MAIRRRRASAPLHFQAEENGTSATTRSRPARDSARRSSPGFGSAPRPSGRTGPAPSWAAAGCALSATSTETRSSVPSVSVPVLSTHTVSTAASDSVAAICCTRVFIRARRTAATARVTLISSTRPSGIRVTRPGGRRLGGLVEVDAPDREGEQQQDRQRDHEDRRRPQHAVDLELKRRGWMAEGAGLAGDLLGVALLADGVDLVVGGAHEAEGAGQQPIAARACGPRRTRRSGWTRPWSGRARTPRRRRRPAGRPARPARRRPARPRRRGAPPAGRRGPRAPSARPGPPAGRASPSPSAPGGSRSPS